jgi:hypothetical protein
VIDHYESSDVPESVDYTKLILPLIAVTQKLKARIDALEAGAA